MLRYEALPAKWGDSQLITWSDGDRVRVMVVDGGPAGVYPKVLRPKLDKLTSGSDRLELDLVVVSHLDADHIQGVLDMTNEIRRAVNRREAPPFEIRHLWSNSFNLIVGNDQASARDPIVGGESSAIRTASVGQAKALQENAVSISTPMNDDGQAVRAMASPPPPLPGLDVTILWPSADRLIDLQDLWDREIVRKGWAVPASATAVEIDTAVTNLASVVMLLEKDGYKLLLTGDALGSDVVVGARAAGLLDDGPLAVEVLKIPHHGSIRNLDDAFLDAFPARHYVLSGNGRHGNPEPAAVGAIIDAAGNREVTLHFTYTLDEMEESVDFDRTAMEAVLASAAAAHVTVCTPGPATGSLIFDFPPL